MTSGIFISYRRLDSKSDARSICQRLEKTFGKRKVFIDVDSIRPGEDFQSVLKNDLEKCNVMVVVIGPRWLDCNNTTSIAVSHDYSPAIIWDGMARFTMAELKDSFRIEPSAFLSASS
jgi:hypothetical protein